MLIASRTFFTSFRDAVRQLVELDVDCMSLWQVGKSRSGSTSDGWSSRTRILCHVVHFFESPSAATVGLEMFHLHGYGDSRGAGGTRGMSGRWRRSYVDRGQRHWRMNLDRQQFSHRGGRRQTQLKVDDVQQLFHYHSKPASEQWQQLFCHKV